MGGGVSYERGTPVVLEQVIAIAPSGVLRLGANALHGQAAVQGYLADKKQPPPRTLQ